jgi:hypothetical protein
MEMHLIVDMADMMGLEYRWVMESNEEVKIMLPVMNSQEGKPMVVLAGKITQTVTGLAVGHDR